MKTILGNSNFGFTKWCVALIAAGEMFGATGWGQISITNWSNYNYTQSFDSLPNTGVTNSWANNTTLAGWHLFNKSGAAIATINVDNGGSNTGSFYSYGTAASTDRALGGAASGGTYFGSPSSGAVAGWIAVSFANNSGGTISSIAIRYDGEQWRNGGNTAQQTMVFEYGFGTTFSSVTTWTPAGSAFNFTSPVAASTAAAVDGNVAGRIQGFGGTLSNLTWANGTTLWMRWIENNDTGNDHGLALDNFSLAPPSDVVIPVPPSLTSVTVEEQSLAPTQAKVISSIISNGGAELTQQGFVYTPTATSTDPTLATVGAVSVTSTPAVGSFTNNLTNLTAGTAYTIKAYAINSAGTNYSLPQAFSTLAAFPTFTGVYTQNFADVTNGTLIPAGWRALSSSNVNGYSGSWTNTNASTGGFYGRAGSPGLLGYLHTSSTGILTNKLTLVNGTGSSLTNLYVSYTGEVNTLNPTSNLRFPTFTVAVGNNTNVGGLSYSTGGGTNASLSAQVTGLNIAQGESIVITWSSDRGAGNGSSRMIGMTDVRVATTPVIPEQPVGAFDSWVSGYPSLSGASAATTADPDGDGLNNAGEFAFGTSPIDSSSRAVTQTVVTGGIKIMYLQRSGVTYTVKSATDLAVGFTGTVTPSKSSPQPTTGLPSGYEQYEATVTAPDRGFLKVEAVVP